MARRVLSTGLLTLLLSALHADASKWVDTWGSMPQLTEPGNLPPAPFNATDLVFQNSTIRQTVRTSIGSDWLRIRISNAFGGSDLPITAVSLAFPANGTAGVSAIQSDSSKAVTFSGNSAFSVPNGAQVVSDPIQFSVKSQQNIAITIYTASGQTTNSITSHPGSRTTSWMVNGNQVDALDFTGQTANVNHWYFISAVEAWTDDDVSSIAVVGDSITDGRGSTDNGNNRWTDLLVDRLLANGATRDLTVINQAAGGNRILADGLGPNALGRIDRDVIAHPNVKYAIIFEGVNDIGTADSTTAAQTLVGDRMIWAYKQMAARLHSSGIPVFAATITPMTGDAQVYGTPEREVTRKRVNQWIKSSGTFDAVFDFDTLLADPANPSQLLAKYDSGDHLHPSVEAYKVMVASIPLNLFSKKWEVATGGKTPLGAQK
ncbi:hypothetical protein H0H87_000831 [Tephrocybe sp. NHM501043]|nr:hypothetical protein H0H87_000831 [Tephrocybe sp. NHM501043]